ncbi:transposase [Streptomyces sp. V4I2]|nr:transposase [Streptomyces sp. V4I2]
MTRCKATRAARPGSVGRRAELKKAAHALVHELLVQGHSRRAIARRLGWGLNTVLRYARAARCQDTFRENRPRSRGPARSSRLDPYEPYLERRFTAGCTSVTQLHSELLTEYAAVTYAMVRAHITTLRTAPPGTPPSVRQVTSWLTHHPTALSEEDRADLKDGSASRLIIAVV